MRCWLPIRRELGVVGIGPPLGRKFWGILPMLRFEISNQFPVGAVIYIDRYRFLMDVMRYDSFRSYLLLDFVDQSDPIELAAVFERGKKK